MRSVSLLLVLSLALSGAACHKKKKEIKAATATPTTISNEKRASNEKAPSETPRTPSSSSPEKLSGSFGPIFFDFDSQDLSPAATETLDRVVAFLEANPKARLSISGHADERGTEEYNLSLGEERARVAREYLLRSQISPDRIKTISYGEEKPLVQGDDEGSLAQNRRDELELIE